MRPRLAGDLQHIDVELVVEGSNRTMLFTIQESYTPSVHSFHIGQRASC